jgi:hypothetical protein
MRQQDIIIMKNKVRELERNIYELEEQRVYLSKKIKDYGDIIKLYKELVEAQEDMINYIKVHHEIP